MESTDVARVSWSASAPGKVILFGEHAVVHGRTALAASIDLRTTATVTSFHEISQGTRSEVLSLDIPSLGVHCKWKLSELTAFFSRNGISQAGSGQTEPPDTSSTSKSITTDSKVQAAARKMVPGGTSVGEVAIGEAVFDEFSAGEVVPGGLASGEVATETSNRLSDHEQSQTSTSGREGETISAETKVLSSQAESGREALVEVVCKPKVGPLRVQSCSEELLAQLRPLAERQLAPGVMPSMAAGVAAFLFLHSYILGDKSASVHISTDLPVGAGLGSSAAFCVALSAALLATAGALSVGAHCRATCKVPSKDAADVAHSHADVALSHADASGISEERQVAGLRLGEEELALVNAWAYEGEKILHGKPSGVDNNVSTYGHVLQFQKGVIKRLPQCRPLRVLLSNTSVPRNTRTLVTGVAERALRHPSTTDSIFTAIDCIAREAVTILQLPLVAATGSACQKPDQRRSEPGNSIMKETNAGLLPLGNRTQHAGSGRVSQEEAVSPVLECRGSASAVESSSADARLGLGYQPGAELGRERAADVTDDADVASERDVAADADVALSRNGKPVVDGLLTNGRTSGTSHSMEKDLTQLTQGTPEISHSAEQITKLPDRPVTGIEKSRAGGSDFAPHVMPPEAANLVDDSCHRSMNLGARVGLNLETNLIDPCTRAANHIEESTSQMDVYSTPSGATHSPRKESGPLSSRSLASRPVGSRPLDPRPSTDHSQLAELVQMSQGLLMALGVSHQSISAICHLMAQHGFSSKLTGAGGGGYVLTLLPPDVEPLQLAKAKKALADAGYDCFEAVVGGGGVRLEAPQELPH